MQFKVIAFGQTWYPIQLQIDQHDPGRDKQETDMKDDFLFFRNVPAHYLSTDLSTDMETAELIHQITLYLSSEGGFHIEMMVAF